MVMMPEQIKKMLNKFSQLEEVDGILLAGSQTSNTQDKNSDYDIYIYTNKEIEVSKRKAITDEYCRYMETNNTFWEPEDDGMMSEDNIPVEIIYRSFKWIDEQLERVVMKHQADVGYTTCFWSNFINSVIIYEKDGKAKKLQEKYRITYPKELKLNIINKNYPLLKKQMPAYYYQIEKAIKRDDYISVNHRIAAFLASYFDILFAVNEMMHPGEKKLVKILKEKAEKLPQNMEEDLNNLIKSSGVCDETVLKCLDKLIYNLDELLKGESIQV